jgi:imidazolonepropionase-like amidohydrolase
VLRLKHYTPYEILKQATSENAALFERSGKRHPYLEGPLGVVKVGAYADVVVVEGNPLKDITLLAEPAKNLKLIMKDGKVYKNTL